jgi:metal-dependent amidase/aminoacylase/carboxypeptidase family protein
VVTVGSVHAGTRSNLIPDHAVLQLNLRSYSQQTRERMLASIQRIVRAEGQATGSPRDPDFKTVGSFPLTVNDPATTDRVAAAFATHFGDHALEIDRQTVSEDFSNIPNAAGVPYTYWAMGFTDEKTYRAAEKAGRLQDLPTNHSPKFLPPLQPTLRTGTEALVAAALAWLGRLDTAGIARSSRTSALDRSLRPRTADPGVYSSASSPWTGAMTLRMSCSLRSEACRATVR